MATATPTHGGSVWVLNKAEESVIKTALLAQYADAGPGLFRVATRAILKDLGEDPEPTWKVVEPPKIPRQYSKVRMLKDCGRWIKPGEEGVIAYIDFDVVNPESDTQFTVVFSPGRYQTMTRECFEVL